MDVEQAIEQIVDWLKITPGYEESNVYKTITKHYPDQKVGRSMALRLLIHYIADIH